MATQSTGNADSWKTYRAEFYLERGHFFAIAAVLVSVVLTVAFLVVDEFLHPAQFWPLAAVRFAMIAAAAFVLLALGRSRPRFSAVSASFLACLMMLVLIYETGGENSSYFAGLMLVFTGIPVLLPLSAIQTSAVVVPMLVGFMMFPWLTDTAVVWDPFGLHSVYLGSSALISIVSAGLLDAGRFAEFRRRREAEQARDRLQDLDRAKSRFTANVHHELRTPLTLLLAPLEAMRAGEFGPLSALQQRTLTTMYTNASRLLKLLSSVLDLAKSEAGELRLKPRRTSVGALAARVVDAAQPLAERKGVELQAYNLETLPALSVDPDALDRVLVNLLGNALKFTPTGGRVILRGETQASAVELVVADTGVGLSFEDLGRIFERFSQVDDSTTREFEGTGIGLAIARELVERHGGRIWAESTGLGKGAALHVRLPRKPDALATKESEVAVGPGGDIALARSFAALEAELDLGTGQSEGCAKGELEVACSARSAPEGTPADLSEGPTRGCAEVLIVEDNGGMRELLARFLGREFRVRTCRDGTEALSAVAVAPPDLMLADVMMPGMSGVELCRRLKQDQRTRGIPMVLLTAKADPASRIEGLEHGAEEYVPKPFHPRELLARVRALVRLRTLQRELAARNHELEEANTALGTSQRNLALYARAVSHDLRSPLAAAAEALRIARGRVPEDRLELLALAEQNLVRADLMLGALRELTRAVGAAEAAVSVDVDCLVAEVMGELALARGGGALPIRVLSPLGLIQAPRQKLAHVFRNLLRNALEALDDTPTPRIEVGCLLDEELGFFVRDNGPGIPYEYQARLFEPFRRGPHARRENMGLGLALVRQLVEQQGGKVLLESFPGRSTTFRFTLPSVPRPPSISATPGPEANTNQVRGEHPT